MSDKFVHAHGGNEEMPPTDYDRERWWWDIKAPREDTDLSDEKINRALRWREIERHLDGVQTILEIGGGTGAFSIPLARRGYQVTHVDLSPQMIELARAKSSGLENIEFVQANAVDLSHFEDRSFDLVLNMDGAVTFCGLDSDKAVAEACRLARKRVVLAVSNRARMIGIALQTCADVLGRSAPIVDDMFDDGYFALERRPENQRLVEGATDSGYFGPMKCYYPNELRGLIEKSGFGVTRCNAMGSLANFIGKEAALKLYDHPEEREKFLDQCERFDAEVMPNGVGTDQRAGLIAVAERRPTASSFIPKTITLADGTDVLLRSPEESEAQQLLEYLDAVRRESEGIMYGGDDELPSLDEERQWVRGNLDREGSLHIAAEVDGHIIALAGIDQAKFVRQRHSAGLGISIRDQWCGRGLGTLMMRELVDWAREHPGLEQLTLCVFASNPRAQAVYRKVGFQEDGRLPRRAKVNGQYIDIIEMSLWLDEAEVLS